MVLAFEVIKDTVTVCTLEMLLVVPSYYHRLRARPCCVCTCVIVDSFSGVVDEEMVDIINLFIMETKAPTALVEPDAAPPVTTVVIESVTADTMAGVVVAAAAASSTETDGTHSQLFKGAAQASTDAAPPPPPTLQVADSSADFDDLAGFEGFLDSLDDSKFVRKTQQLPPSEKVGWRAESGAAGLKRSNSLFADDDDMESAAASTGSFVLSSVRDHNLGKDGDEDDDIDSNRESLIMHYGSSSEKTQKRRSKFGSHNLLANFGFGEEEVNVHKYFSFHS